MQKITNIIELKEAIRLLEIQHASEGVLLKEQIKVTYESMKPANLIKNTIVELSAMPDFKADLLNTTMGLAAGYISKKMAVGSSNNPFKQILGTLLQMGVSGIVSRNGDDIKSGIMRLINNFLSKKDESKDETSS